MLKCTKKGSSKIPPDNLLGGFMYLMAPDS